MHLFNNYWFRWFAGGFFAGATVLAVAGTTDQFKDLKIETLSGSAEFWVLV